VYPKEISLGYTFIFEVSSNRKGNFPLNAKTRKLIRRKNRLWSMDKIHAMETRDGTKYLEYCKSRNKLRALTRKLQKEFERNLAHQTKKNPKVFLRYICTINPKLQSNKESWN